MSKIDLKSEASKRQIANLRSQVTDVTSLRKIDEFVAKNSTFDFNNDTHTSALKKQTCDCDVTVSPTINTRQF